MKVLLISNQYIEDTLVNVLDGLLSAEVTQIVLLEENNNPLKCSHKVIICPNLEVGIRQCDIVLLVKYPEISLTLEDNIQWYCEKYQKKYICVENATNSLAPCATSKELCTVAMKEIPIILLLAVGEYNQHTYIELILQKLFKDLNINSKLLLSNEALNILQQLAPNSINGTDDNYGIIIQTIVHKTINDVLQNDCLAKIMNEVRPDFTIMCVESGLDKKCNIDTVIEHIGIRYNISIDMIIVSNYCDIRDSKKTHLPIYCEQKVPTQFYSMDDMELSRKIKHKIITKLSLPNNISIL